MQSRDEFIQLLTSNQSKIIQSLEEQLKEFKQKREATRPYSIQSEYYTNKASIAKSDRKQYINHFDRLKERAISHYDLFHSKKVSPENEHYTKPYLQSLIDDPKRSKNFDEFVKEQKFETENTLSIRKKGRLMNQFVEKREKEQNETIRVNRLLIEQTTDPVEIEKIHSFEQTLDERNQTAISCFKAFIINESNKTLREYGNEYVNYLIETEEIPEPFNEAFKETCFKSKNEVLKIQMTQDEEREKLHDSTLLQQKIEIAKNRASEVVKPRISKGFER